MAKGKQKEAETLEKAAVSGSNDREQRRLQREAKVDPATAAEPVSRKRPLSEEGGEPVDATAPGGQPVAGEVAPVAASPVVKPRKRAPRSRKHQSDDADEDLVDEHGNKIAIPEKHGTPILHTRPKSNKQRLSQGEAAAVAPGMLSPLPEGAMMIRIHGYNGIAQAADQQGIVLPIITIPVSPNATLNNLRAAICTSTIQQLPQPAQMFYRKVGEQAYEHLDPSLQYNITLKDCGYDLPGPHDIWVAVDMSVLYGLGNPGGTPPPPAPALAPPPALQVTSERPSKAKADEGATGKTRNTRSAAQVADPPAVPVEAPMQAPVEAPAEVPAEAAPAAPHHRNKLTVPRNRPNKRWADSEIDNLLLGLMKFGTSSWTKIAERWKFDDRTTVDLKDKWRNLVKNVRDGRPMRGMVLSEETKNRVWRIMHENGIPIEPQAKQLQSPLQSPQSV